MTGKAILRARLKLEIIEKIVQEEDAMTMLASAKITFILSDIQCVWD